MPYGVSVIAGLCWGDMNARALPLAVALALAASAARAAAAPTLPDTTPPGAGKYSVCPPSDSSCWSGFMDGSAKNDPTQTIAAYDPPPGQKWASDSCRHIPCAVVPDPNSDKADNTPDIQGPPSMKPFDNGILKGNALYFPDGTVSYCFDNSCSTRMSPAEAKAYLDKKATDDANKKAFSASGKDIKDDKPNDKGGLKTTATDNGSHKGAGDDATTPDKTSVKNNPGYEDGKSVASMFDIGGAGEIGSGGQGDPRGKDAPPGTNGQSVILVDGNTEVSKHAGFTFTKTARNAELLREFSAKTAGAFTAPPDPDAGTPINPKPTRAATNSD